MVRSWEVTIPLMIQCSQEVAAATSVERVLSVLVEDRKTGSTSRGLLVMAVVELEVA